MKIVYIVETYTEGLGYIDNILPLHLARLGHSVDVITCRLPVYYQKNSSHFGALNLATTSEGVESKEGVSIHTLGYNQVGSRIVIKGLHAELGRLKPDIVMVRGIASLVVAQLVFAKLTMRFKLFTSTGMAYSAVSHSLKGKKKLTRAKVLNFFTRKIPGRMFSYFIQYCIGSTQDCADVVVEFYGVPRSKTRVISLGVDLEMFYPVRDEASHAARVAIRERFGYSDDTILCIWTGRMITAKAVELLAEAVEQLNDDGYKFEALFIGEGPCSDSLTSYKHSKLVKFMPWKELPLYYRAADIAVWPKSLTTSTLDATACGLPVILSDMETAVERWEGTGSSYKEGDVEDLKQTILKFEDVEARQNLKKIAFQKMEKNFNWSVIARQFEALFMEQG